MATVPESLTAKVGPLPVWAWAVGVSGVVIVAMRLRARQAPELEADAAAAAEAAAAEAAEAARRDELDLAPSPLGGGGTWVPAPTGSDEPTTPTTPNTRNAYETNNAWRRAALDWLIAAGFDALLAQNALTKFLDGNKVTAAEASAIRAVLRDFGTPPEGAPSLIVEPAPAPPSSAPAPRPSTPRTPAPAPARPGRPNLSIGSTGQVVRNLSFWLNTHADGRIGQPFDRYHGGHEAAVDKLLRYLNKGTRDAKAGPSGVNQWTYGLIDYLSSVKGVASV